jgi:TRAP-type C4-dicarboxylate transport system substrate-binding protein
MISAVPLNFPEIPYILTFVDKVNERSDGELTIEVVGGPEVIPANDQATALRAGVIDFMIAIFGYYRGAVPEAATPAFSRITPDEERESGYYDWMLEAHMEKLNAYYLGRTIWAEGGLFYTFIDRPVESLEDLEGLSLRVSSTTAPFAEALGINGATLSHSEAYTAIERGVVSGLMTVMSSFEGRSYYEILKYYIDHPYYQQNHGLIMNLDTFNELPDHLQDLVVETAIEIEQGGGEFYTPLVEEVIQRMEQEHGVSPVTFSPDDAEQYLDYAYSSQWEKLAGEELGPAVVAEVRPMLE